MNEAGGSAVAPGDGGVQPVRVGGDEIEMGGDGIHLDRRKGIGALRPHRAAEADQRGEIARTGQADIGRGHRVLVFMTGATASRVNGTGSSPPITTRVSVS